MKKGKPSGAGRRKSKITDEYVNKLASRCGRKATTILEPEKRQAFKFKKQATIQPSRILSAIGDTFTRFRLRLRKQSRDLRRDDIVVRVGKTGNKNIKSVYKGDVE